MICDKHCPLLDKDTGDCKKDEPCELKATGSICGDCVHDEVCGLEGHLDPAMTFCADMLHTDVVGMISRTSGLRLSDIMGVLPSSWFTVTAPTGTQNDAIPYRHPEQYKVLKITYDQDEKKICVIVEKA